MRSLLLVFFLSLCSGSDAADPLPTFRILLNCGATVATVTAAGETYFPDYAYVSSGVPKNLSNPSLLPLLSTIRSFPFNLSSNKPQKFCYAVPVVRRKRHLVRTTYFYGGVNGVNSPLPPVFDQIVDGTFWTVVNTTEDYARGSASYYEAVVLARGKTMSVCVAGNTYTESDPFISVLEVILLDDLMYTGVNFNTTALGLITRSNFGSDGPTVGYPDDQFKRYWEPFVDGLLATSSSQNKSASGFWNNPPPTVLNTAATTSDQNQPLELNWPLISLPNSSYYVALYFADTSSMGSRIVNVFINGITFYSNFEVTSSGIMVFATPWILSGQTRITLTSSSALPPLVNAGEIFGLFSLGGLTLTRDVIGLESIRRSINNPPNDWNGDPCMPPAYSWTGVTCSEGPRIRVIGLNMSGMGLSGSLSPSISNLTALTEISFADNELTGTIPNLRQLKRLEKLHLHDNQFSGTIPQSLGDLPSLKELFLQNNNLIGVVPQNLRNKPGLNLKVTPGNHLRPSSPST